VTDETNSPHNLSRPVRACWISPLTTYHSSVPPGCDYQRCDPAVYNAQPIDDDFQKCRLATDPANNADIIAVLGVLEYMTDAETFSHVCDRATGISS